MLSCMWDGAYKEGRKGMFYLTIHKVHLKETFLPIGMLRQRVSSLAIRVVIYYMSDAIIINVNKMC